MTVKNKSGNGKAQNPLSEGIQRVNSLLQNVEEELNKTLTSARRQGKRSALTFKRTVDDLVNNVKNPTELRKKAMQRSGKLRREIKRFSTGVLSQLRSFEDNVLENMVDKLKDNLSNTVTRLQDSELMEFAKVKMNDTREQVLTALQIPSNSELEQLTRKLTILERKLNALKKHDARE